MFVLEFLNQRRKFSISGVLDGSGDKDRHCKLINGKIIDLVDLKTSVMKLFSFRNT